MTSLGRIPPFLFFYVFIIPTFDCHFKTSITMSNSDIPIELKLKAYPYDLAADETQEYYVKVHTQSTPLTQDDLARAVARRLGAEPALAQSFIEVFMEELSSAIGQGYCVSTDASQLRPVAHGTLTHAQLSQPITPEQIEIRTGYRQGPLLTEVLSKARCHLFLQPATVGPYPLSLANALSTAQNPRPLRVGEMVVLTGVRLKIVGSHPDVGIRLTSEVQPDVSYLVTSQHISPNTPKRLQFVLPVDMPAGLWKVEVTTQYTPGRYLAKEPRTAALSSPVYIEAAPL